MTTITIKATKPGKFPLSVGVEGQKYFLGSASLEYEVADYKAVIKQDKPTTKKVAVGTPVTFSAQLLSSGAPVTGNYIYRWQPTPEVEFNPIEGAKNTTTATFSRPGVTKVWVQVLEKKGTVLTTLAESDQIDVEAVNPELSIKFTPEKVFRRAGGQGSRRSDARRTKGDRFPVGDLGERSPDHGIAGQTRSHVHSSKC